MGESTNLRDYSANHLKIKIPDDNSPRALTATEEKICIGLALGLTAKEIAKARGSSYRTIERHIANIKIKIGCRRLPPILLMQLVNNYSKS